MERLGNANVHTIVDCSEEVFRLGYGSLDAIQKLRAAGCRVRQSAGLRTAVLACDDTAWTFTPTALYVEPEVHSDETPNAVLVPSPAVERIFDAIAERRRTPLPDDPSSDVVLATAHPEIGVAELSNNEVAQAAAALDTAPPLPFDVARQVRVFEAYLQYVDISLKGCAIQRHRLEVPKTIQGLDRVGEFGSRLRTTFDLIERDSNVSSKPLEYELNAIRNDFTRSLGQRWGRVILRNSRPKFDERIAQFRDQLDAHRETVRDSLEDHLQTSRNQLVEYFLPIAVEAPPDALVGQTIGRLSEDQVRTWLEAELDRVFPEPHALVADMRVEVVFRDITTRP